jgi:muramoyltetrapeptide carboxypeptidase LdcA involved in peptidoglycan recycling
VKEPPREQREEYREQVAESIIEQVERYNPNAPVVLGLDWGHTTPIAPLPIGGRVTVDPEERIITF